jgi:signal transduction histidine kinase
VLLVTLAIAALLAVVVSVLVGRDLNVRLAAIHRGLLEVAAGRRPAAGSAAGPDVERLADALDGLVEAMDRREGILREASMTVAGWHPEIGERATATAAVEGGARIFGARACWIVAADGSRLAGSPPTTSDPGSRRLEAPLETGGGPTGWLHAEVTVDPPWSEADDALFGMYALLVGGALDDARVHEVTSERVERLGRLNDLQREFLRSVSHNLQTPLTTITLVADDLADPSIAVTQDDRARRVRAIQVQARRLDRLVSQLITVSRLDAGRLELEHDAVTIAPIVRRVWSALDTDRTLDVADGAGDVVPLGDRGAIEQILWILLDNAVRYAPTGPIRVATSAEPAADGPRVRIEVQDVGPGVPEADRRRIFQRFWSGSSDGTHGGTGIGLDIARRLARAMAGSLRYEAGRTPGATFVLTLPGDVARPD